MYYLCKYVVQTPNYRSLLFFLIPRIWYLTFGSCVLVLGTFVRVLLRQVLLRVLSLLKEFYMEPFWWSTVLTLKSCLFVHSSISNHWGCTGCEAGIHPQWDTRLNQGFWSCEVKLNPLHHHAILIYILVCLFVCLPTCLPRIVFWKFTSRVSNIQFTGQNWPNKDSALVHQMTWICVQD